jgi:hypothetical protein
MKTLLALLILIPFNLFAEQSKTYYGKWTEHIHIDDFTDVKVILVESADDEKKNFFTIRKRDDEYPDYAISLPTIPACIIEHKFSIDVIFRVDKNKVFTLPMVKQINDPRIYQTNYDTLSSDGVLFRNYFSYLDELRKGKILKIRIDDPHSGCKKDLTFKLKNFDKAIRNLYNEASDLINFSIIDKELFWNDSEE